VTETVTAPAAAPTAAPPVADPPWRRLPLGSDRFWGWAAPLLITLIGGMLRFWRLDRPGQLVFDEVYYTKEAASFLQRGYELSVNAIPTGSPDPFTLGSTDVFGTNGAFVVHPPVGKWMIAAGEWLAGAGSPWGWRLSAAVVGTLAILMVGRIARRLFGSTLLGAVAAGLLALDGQEFVHSRTGILDIFVMFWALAAFGCLLIDRDNSRARLLVGAASSGTASGSRFGPWSGVRWWRLAGLVCLGLCTGVKWSGLYFSLAFVAMSVLWDVGTRRAAGARSWLATALVRDGGQAAVSAALVVPAVYLAGWTGWFLGGNGYDRKWADTHPAMTGLGWLPNALRSLWHYHAEMWHFNITLHTPHNYQANPWSWLVLGRPTAFYYDKHQLGDAGCRVSECNQAVLPLGNPVIWWVAAFAVGVLLFRWALSRDWRAGAVLAGYVGGYLPWFLYQERTIFSFYAVAFVPWVVLAVTYCVGLVLGPDGASPGRVLAGRSVVAGYLMLVFAAFWYFYPIYAAELIPHSSWLARMWFPSWI
jgi:dolichyl-phosphate-mannose--protein O-mannosyl transferase